MKIVVIVISVVYTENHMSVMIMIYFMNIFAKRLDIEYT